MRNWITNLPLVPIGFALFIALGVTGVIVGSWLLGLAAMAVLAAACFWN